MTVSPIDWLFGLAQFGIKFGLDNIHALVAELGHPERTFRSVHVAGTNGKGSVTAMVEAALRAAGVRTGRYTSPHLLRLNERFAVDGVPVDDELMIAAVETVRQAVSDLQRRRVLEVHPTFFEVTTAVAFEIFRRCQVDIAVCEVGLGGRLDATNVLVPVACAITSIAFDHQQYLGSTLASIAGEKAGIIKPGVPVVAGPMAAEAAGVIARHAVACRAPLIWALDQCRVAAADRHTAGMQRITLQTPARDYGTIEVALDGAHQVTNAVVAVRLLEQVEALGIAVGRDGVATGVASVQWPGRLQHVRWRDGGDLLLDAAHNEAGARALAAHLAALGPPRPLVFAAMRDKDCEAMLQALLPAVSAVVVTRASNPRSAEPSELAALARRIRAVPVEVRNTPAAAVARALEESRAVVVAGSIFLLADVLKEIVPS